MSDWTGNNVAHRQTWYVLRVMDQNRLGFKESKEVRMDQLTYWAATGSADMRAQRAKAMATEMDNIFRMILNSPSDGLIDEIANDGCDLGVEHILERYPLAWSTEKASIRDS